MSPMEPYRHKVQYYETDKMQFTHHSNYVRFMEEARIDFFERIGWPYDKIEAEGAISPVVGISCSYRRSTTYPDVIDIVVSVLEASPVRFRLGYTMTVGGTVVCTAESAHCFLDGNGKPLSLKKKYPEFYALMQELKEKNV